MPENGAVALLGPNGAGKTTTIRAISGLLDLHHGFIRDGEIRLDGVSLKGMRTNRIVGAGVAQVPEGRHVFKELTVEENLRVGASARARPGVDDSMAQIFDLFPRLKERIKQQAGWLSGGEQQMVAIGRALMAAPRLLLLDEVSLGLAPRVIEDIFDATAVRCGATSAPRCCSSSRTPASPSTSRSTATSWRAGESRSRGRAKPCATTRPCGSRTSAHAEKARRPATPSTSTTAGGVDGCPRPAARG